MYLILNTENLIKDITAQAGYVRRQNNEVIVGCDKSNADAIYSANSDTFYPLERIGYIGDAHTFTEVDAVPAGVVAGYYFYRSGEFYSTEDKLTALALSRAQEDILPVANIVFVTLAEGGQLDDVTATEHITQFLGWVFPVAYTVGQIRRNGDKLYRCTQAHTSQEDWTPEKTPALWTAIGDPAIEYPDWAQPVGSHDAYNAGDKVTHNGKRWTSNISGNVWAPGAYGWTEV